MAMVPLLHSLPLLLLTASCAAFPVATTSAAPFAPAAVQNPAPTQLPEDGFRPIQFGDKEGYEWTEAFFPGTTYDSAITTPSRVLGQTLGSRLAHHGEILKAFQLWDTQSNRLSLHEYGRTYEGRALVYAVITSPANHERLEEIRMANQALSDPRGLSVARGKQLVAELPAVAWMGYSIHGDETSGSDASLAVAYQLVAGRGAQVDELLENLVIILDPCLNPDGRMRIVPMTEQLAGFRTSLDPASMSRGHWPYGRGNHYLFDMNRDWMAGVTPETRGRWAVNQRWRPQLFVDAHEQGGSDTFLMYPQASPRHPSLPAKLLKWQGAFADDQAAAFDHYGWGYYTREWADAWFPGYSDAWGSLNGAIGMLYEQGSFAGQPYERPSGEIVPYRRAVHAQALASWSNLKTLAKNRSKVLADYLAHRRSQVDGSRADAKQSFMFTADAGDSRTASFVDLLLRQGIEVWRATEDFSATNAVHSLGKHASLQEFPAGTWVIPMQQPQGGLVRAYLEFDPRMTKQTLAKERASLERGEGSKLYDITAWDLGRAYDLDAWWADTGDLALEQVESATPMVGNAVKDFPEAAYAWAIDSHDDRILRFAARAMEMGLHIHLADKAFLGRTATEATSFDRGSLLLRQHENQGLELDAIVAQVAAETGVRAIALTTGRAPDLIQPDLGGQHFQLLRRPHVALLTGPSVGTSGFGHVWQYLDEVLRIPTTLLDLDSLGGTDLRPYNLIIAPPGSSLGDSKKELAQWVRNGGTLIAMGSAAASICDSELTTVKLRSNALDELEDQAFAVQRYRAAGAPIDFDALWGDPKESPPHAEPGKEGEKVVAAETTDEAQPQDDNLERRESWLKLFSPQGAILRVDLDQQSYLTGGRDSEIPVYAAGRRVYLSTQTVSGRYAAADHLRLGGLLWPEARERIADSVWLSREGHGRGQVILFAQNPVFRGSWKGSARLLGNAIVLGPGAGADPPPGR